MNRRNLWLVVTLFVILVTLLLGYTVTSAPRSWIIWTILVFLCFVEFASGVVVAESSTVDAPGRTSSAMASVIAGSARLFGIVGIATIVLAFVFGQQTASRDVALVSFLVLETVAFLVSIVLLRGTDQAVQLREQPRVIANRLLTQQSARIGDFIHSLRSLKPADVDQSIQIESLVKGFGSSASQLRHCYASSPDIEARIDSAIKELEDFAGATAQGAITQAPLARLEQIQRDLQGFVPRLVTH